MTDIKANMEAKVSFDNVAPSYSNFQPKINLEVLSAKSANRMILLTYFVFIICLFLDLFTVLESLQIKSNLLSPGVCTICNNTSTDSYTYRNYFYNQNNVVTFQVEVSQSNFTNLVDWTVGSQPHICSPVSLSYDLDIWSCYNANGCTSFDQPNSNINNENSWHISKQVVNAVISTDMCTLSSLSDKYSYMLLSRTYKFEVTFIPLTVYICIYYIIWICINLSCVLLSY